LCDLLDPLLDRPGLIGINMDGTDIKFGRKLRASCIIPSGNHDTVTA
jgi:hypothetical protein